ncbi:MAG: hypothetical protein JNK82_12020 [Myxococcaceae bacterium]|nr:hypothetical protein [Myxococcaceae bacterium]
MTRRLAAAALIFAGCIQLPDDVTYLCETDGSCAQLGYTCHPDGRCRASSNAGGSGGGSAGGATAGGLAGGGDTAGGGNSAAGGGNTCVPTGVCPTGALACGTVDSGCGYELGCWRDGGLTGSCPGAGAFCGAGVSPNLCSAPISCVDGWCWENPLPQGNTLNAAWASSERDVWAVGNVGTLLHYNGQYWKTAPTPTRLDLFAVHGTGASDVWAVGERGVVLRYDGQRWALDHVSDAGLDLRAVAALPAGVVISGGAQGYVHQRAASGAWSNGTTGVLTEVRALRAFSPTDVYAAGTGNLSQAARWNGSAWSAIDTPGLGPINALFGSSSSDLLSAGNGCQLAALMGGGLVPVAAAAGCNVSAVALAGTRTGDLFIAGEDTVWYFDGGSAQSYATAPGQKFFGAAALDSGVAALVGSRGLVARATAGETLSRTSTGAAVDLNGVYAIDRNNVFAASSNPGGVFVRSTSSQAGRWAPFSGMAGPSSLNAIWGTTDGGSGGVQLYTGSNSVPGQYRPAGFTIGPDLPPQYAVTRHAGFIHFGTADGGHFRIAEGALLTSGLQQRFLPNSTQRDTVRGLFSNGDRLWGITEQGALIDGDGEIWPGIKPLVWPWPMRAVHGTPFDVAEPLVVAVGHDGGIFMGGLVGAVRFVDAGTRDHLNGVYVADSARGYAVGAGGAAWRWNGAAWSSLTAPTREELLGISGVPDAGVWAVGRAGTVLFRPAP